MMITASHNPKEDNGIKIIEDNGDVLPIQWEPVVEMFVNTSHLEETLVDIFDQLETKYKIKDNAFLPEGKEHVSFGMDTRASGERLVKMAMTAVEAMGLQTTFFG